MDFEIKVFDPTGEKTLLPGLIELTQDAVRTGASIGFMLPLNTAGIEEYWNQTLEVLQPGRHAVLLALDDEGRVAGAVQLIRPPKANGIHRAEVAKLMVHTKYRSRGLGRNLMAKLETLARRWGVSLLVLDTATKEAEALYRSMDYALAGQIPGYALDPDGSGPHASSFYYKNL